VKRNFFFNKCDSYSSKVYLLSLLSDSASLHIFHKCTKMYLLTVPSFNHLHFYRPRNYWHILVRNNMVQLSTAIVSEYKQTSWSWQVGWNDRLNELNLSPTSLKYLEVIFKVTFPWRCLRGCLTSPFSSQRHHEKEMQPKSYALEIGQLRFSFAPISIGTNWRHK